VQGSAFVAANMIITHPLVMSAATEIFFFTVEIPPRSSQLVEKKVQNLNDKNALMS
jgi:hypothetical protein